MTIVRAATLRQKLQIKLAMSPAHKTPGRPILALTLYRQAPGRVATAVPKTWTRQGKAGFDPGLSRCRGGRLISRPPPLASTAHTPQRGSVEENALPLGHCASKAHTTHTTVRLCRGERLLLGHRLYSTHTAVRLCRENT